MSSSENFIIISDSTCSNVHTLLLIDPNESKWYLTRDHIFELSDLLNEYKKTLVESSEEIEDDCTDCGC